jgi:isopentenyldiphosphate isomerase
MEHFDVLDCGGNKTGGVIARDEAHRTGVWHGAFHCLILYERENREYVLFQKRSMDKKIAPGKFDVSVGGHYTAGEDAATAGPREIREELGLDVRFDELLSVGRRVFVYCFSAGVIECEFQDIFLLPRRIQPELLVLQQEEVDGVLKMDVEQGISLFGRKVKSIKASFHRPGLPMAEITVSTDDFVPCIDNYYLKLLLLSKRFLAGERDLLVI